MKNFKKISWGAILAGFVLIALSSINPGKSLAADPFNLGYISSDNSIGGSYKGSNFVFTLDSPAASSPWTFGIASNGPICEGSEITNVSPDNLGKKTITAKATNFRYQANGSACTSASQGTPYNGTLTIAPSTNGGTGTGTGGGSVNSKPINWKGAKGVLDSSGALLTVKFSDGTTLKLTDNNTGDSTVNFKPSTPGKYGGVVVASWCSNTILATSGGDPSFGISLSSYSATKGTVKVCYTSDNAQKSITQSGISIPVDTSAYTKTQGAGQTADVCDANAGPFGWIICPALKLFDSIVNQFDKALKGLLSFDVSSNLTPGVKSTWSIFKNIASALLVVIMLIAVYAQATGGGPVDAYTARKIIPRLVAAVIIMQLSWPIMIWVIELANAMGDGVRDLISAPFGGWQKLDLEHLVGALHLTGSLTAVGLFSGLIATAAFSGLTIGGILLLACAAVLSLFIAFAVLIIRNMLIVLLVMLAPIAILLWILPGTERYWKMWWDNFIKLLMLFPLIMAMVYAGRVFASVAAGNGTPIIATFVVFVGFFGPYFFLPQAFKWGGQMFGAIAGGAWSATKGMRNFPARYAMGRAAENREQRATERATRLASNPNNRRMFDRLLAGEFNYARARGRGGRLGAREMQFAKTLAEGEKATRESVPAQLLMAGVESMRHGPAVNERGERIREGEEGYEQNKLDAYQAWLEGRTYAGVTPDEALQGHAFDMLAQLGDPDRIREARESGHVSPQVWSQAMARNFGRMNEIARYMTLAPDLSNLAPRQFATQDDDTAEELLRQISADHPYIHDRETGGRTELTPQQHQEQLQRAANLAEELTNPLVWSDLGQTKRRVVTDILSMTAAAGIQPSPQSVAAGGRRNQERPGNEPPAPAPPAPPEGPGPEADSGEIHIDR